ncbi:MAG: hypothetical protein H7Y03_13575 [Chitinophagaceae bacterium]|nr:hypothetical protein [Chitinophagaceae bacterium]
MSENQEHPIDRLISWSKWMITLSFASGVGCVVIMKTAEETARQRIGAIFFLAILFFCLAVMCSALFIFRVSASKTITAEMPVPHLWLTKLQLAFFAAGLLFVLVWVAMLSWPA